MTLYEILGVSKDASQEAIKHAYRAQAQRLHPDKEGGDKDAFQRLQAAYDVLSDPERRAQYDATGSTEQHDKRAGMMAELANMIIAAVSQCPSPETTDLIDFVRHQIRQALNQLRTQRANTVRTIERQRGAHRRLKFKGTGENVILAMFAASMANNERHLAGFDAAEQRAESMLALLDEYEYEVDQRADTMPTYSTSFWTAGR